MSYKAMTMEQVRAVPPNGLSAVSLFSGCGGSSLGYRMAGFKVLMASEFVEAARDSYKANFPDTLVDDRDVRQLTAADVLNAIGLDQGQLDVLDGSPPCASFTTAGKRNRGWGRVSKYSDKEQRSDDLFFEYARILKGVQPRAFVAENVPGLTIGKAKGYFLQILDVLKGCGYRVSARILDAQWLNVPQARRRLIFVGVREDLAREPVHPAPMTHRWTLSDALGDRNGLPVVRRMWVQGYKAGQRGWDRVSERNPRTTTSPSVMAADGGAHNPMHANPVMEALPLPPNDDEHDTDRPPMSNGYVIRKYSIPELRMVCGFPADFVLTGRFDQRWERLGRAVPPPVMQAVSAELRDKVLT